MQQQTPGGDTVILDRRYHGTRVATQALVAELERSLGAGELKLPSLPKVVLKIRRALTDESVSTGEIARLLGTDPALAARTLRVANSAMFYRGGRPITSLKDAVAQLGRKMIRNVALSFAAQQAFIGYGNRALHDLVGGVWRHSVHTAVVAHMLARVRTKLNADEAFLAGLLHAVGKLYIFVTAKDDVAALAGAPGFEAVLAEWHPRVGRAVMEAWQLSPELAEAVGGHLSCALAALDPPSLTAVVAVANYLAERNAAACADPEFHSKVPSFGALSMDKSTFDWLIRAADVEVRILTVAFGV